MLYVSVDWQITRRKTLHVIFDEHGLQKATFQKIGDVFEWLHEQGETQFRLFNSEHSFDVTTQHLGDLPPTPPWELPGASS